MLKLLQTGHSLATIAQLKALGMASGIYPLLDVVVQRADEPFVNAALQDTDRRVSEGKPVAPSFLLACVLWSDVRDGWAGRLAHKQHPFPALQDAIDDVFNSKIGDVSGRGKLAGDMREIWMMQPRFEKRIGSTPFSLVEQPRFRAGFDFMRLRADVGEVDVVLADWWQEFSQASDAVREDLVAQLRDEQHKGQRRVRAPRPAERPADLTGQDAPRADRGDHSQPVGRSQSSEQANRPADDAREPGAFDAPRKRRRRRRKPTGEGGSSSTAEPTGL
jgi:poly(A) polymerase